MVMYGFHSYGVYGMGNYLMASYVGNMQLVSYVYYVYGCTCSLSITLSVLGSKQYLVSLVFYIKSKPLIKHTHSQKWLSQ